jgi:hypothetical protein
MNLPSSSKDRHSGSVTAWTFCKALLSDHSFVVAAAILGLSAAGWTFTMDALHWSQMKTPVAWPAGVVVSEDFRWTNLPDRLGKYVLIDRRTNRQDPNTKADGEVVLDPETRDTLGVGRYEDAPRRAIRSSNWYSSRIYEDATWPLNSAFRFWQLDIIYYTGAAEKVEHVPDRCMVAGGYTPSGDRGKITCPASSVRGGWPASLDFVRAGFVKSGKNATPQGQEIAEYYTFILNGTGETSWERIRLHMATTPWEKHCYFAKIQFTPLEARGGQLKASLVSDLGACDRAAQSFVNAFLPEVLRSLPTSAKIDELNNGRNQK